MKRNYSIFLFCLIGLSFFAVNSVFAGYVVDWTWTYNDSAIDRNDFGNDIAVDNFGNVYVAGSSDSGLLEQDDIWIKKCLKSGTTVWIRTYNSHNNAPDYGNGIAVNSFGDVYVTGDSGSLLQASNVWTRKYDTNGFEIWTSTYNSFGNNNDYGKDITVDSFGNVYVIGHEHRTDLGQNFNIWIRKYDKNGFEIWTSTYNSPNNHNDYGEGIAVDGSGNVYVIGNEYRDDLGQSTNIWIRKYDADGNDIWTRTYNSPANDHDMGYSIAVDSSENVYVTGREYRGDLGERFNIWTRKYDTDGNDIWTRTYNSPANSDDGGYGIAVDNSGNVYVTGYEYRGDLGEKDNIWIRKYDTNGNVIWTDTYSSPSNDSDCGRGIAVDSAGNIYVTGYEYRDDLGEWANIWSRKYKLLCKISGTITEDGSPLSGVTVNLTGYSTANTITDGSGNYVFNNLEAGATYIVTPTKINYTFAPVDITYTDLSGDINNADFIGTLRNLIADLSIKGTSFSYCTLQWTAPGIPSSQADEYDIRYSESNITELNWVSATQVSGEPIPKNGGDSETFTVSGLGNDTTYYFAIKSKKDASWSDLSNVVTAHTGVIYGNGSQTISFTPNDGYHISDWVVNIWLFNSGGVTASNVTAEIVNVTDWVIIDDAAAAYPDINAGQQAESAEGQPFMFDLTNRPPATNYIMVWLNITYSLSGKGSSSEIISLKLEIPGKDSSVPKNLTALSRGSFIKLRWHEVSGADSYNVYRLSGDSWKKINHDLTVDNSFKDENVTDGIEYCYKVTSVSGTSESGFSAVAKVVFEKEYETLDEIITYPNPAKEKVTFGKLPKGSKITIYTLNGEEVYTLEVKGSKSDWYLINKAGKKVSNGIYYYVIKHKNGNKTGKLAIVR